MRKKLTLKMVTLRAMTEKKLEEIGGGPGHGQTNRCTPYSFPFWCQGSSWQQCVSCYSDCCDGTYGDCNC